MHTVYIKAELSCIVSHKKITVADVCQVYAAEEKQEKEEDNDPFTDILKLFER